MNKEPRDTAAGIHSPATEEDLIAAGVNPDDWRGHDGEIIGHGQPSGPISDGVVSVPAEEFGT